MKVTSCLKRRLACILAAMLAGLAVLSAVGGRDASLRRLRRAGVVRIGYAVEAPYAYLSEAGVVTGEAPEVARRVVERLGVGQVVWRNMEFDALIPALLEGQIDVVAAGMFVTEARARQVCFSLPTFKVRHGLLVAKGNPFGICCCDDVVTNRAVRVAVLDGAVEGEMLRGCGVPEGRLCVVPDALTGRAAVEAGVADALALSAPTVKWMAQEGRLGRTESLCGSGVFPPGLESAHGAFAFRKGDRKLAEAWNACLEGFLGSPEHLALVGRFGFTSAEMPDTVVCKGGGE